MGVCASTMLASALTDGPVPLARHVRSALMTLTTAALAGGGGGTGVDCMCVFVRDSRDVYNVINMIIYCYRTQLGSRALWDALQMANVIQLLVNFCTYPLSIFVQT